MTEPYRPMLLALLSLLGCTAKEDDTGDTSDTADTGDTADTADTATELGCYSVPPETTVCPDASTVVPKDVIPETCGAVVLTVDGAGSVDGCAWIGGIAASWCIYPITVIPPDEPCDYGRPLVVAGAPRLAPLCRRDGWTAAVSAVAASPERAATWARIGLAEHASVASFARFTLELLAVGAPADLVAAAQDAAQDEVRHAQLAFGLAARFGLPTAGPGPLPLADLTVRADLAALVDATVREGCVAETLSALQMALARDLATDPAERAALAVIARDEARHAELAWRFVRWAISVGPPAVRAAAEAAFAAAEADLRRSAAPPASPDLPTRSDSAAGLLPPEVARGAIARGWREVLTPAARAMLPAAQATDTAAPFA